MKTRDPVITKIANQSKALIFDINYKVQDLNILLLQLTTEVEDLKDKSFLRDEIIEMINQFLKVQIYLEKKRISLTKVYNLFEATDYDLDKLKSLKKPTNKVKA